MIKLSPFVGFIPVAAAPIILTTADPWDQVYKPQFCLILNFFFFLPIFFLSAMFIQWHFNGLEKKELIAYAYFN